MLRVGEQAGEPELCIPAPLSLPFTVLPSLKRRLDDLRDLYSNKRRRVEADELMVPSSLSIEELRSKYIVHEEVEHVVSGSSVRVFQISTPDDARPAGRLEGPDDARPAGRWEGRGIYYMYLANTTADNIALPMHARVTRGTVGSFYNSLHPEDEEKLDALPSTLVRWAWRLTWRSLFQFGDQVGRFQYGCYRADDRQGGCSPGRWPLAVALAIFCFFLDLGRIQGINMINGINVINFISRKSGINGTSWINGIGQSNRDHCGQSRKRDN